MSEIAETVDVEVPVGLVYDQWTQFATFPEFMAGVVDVVQHGDTRMTWEIVIGGRHRRFDAEVVEQVPDERIAWRTVDGVTHDGVVAFHRLDAERTRVTLRMRTVPEGTVDTLGDRLGLVRGRVKDDLRRFKHFIEERRTPTGAWRGEVPPRQ
ncbi:polyketide cyclase/dehydrase/lipid transport protein [Murinocardiopsis flavida]|uniref:Polyketide cyclase/dehydrase/lipid transport protein n=1 Tax=Murinocardiopsis flavida TaxID=645275 RepID=A0A2P8DML8_9ACTN|nr:SRPBCC family protein [Murinocardiopsis flavida]PSK98451.1 polyketide cyclase/dehydrase/lipid transport protein [Murinocardiopsis flavida]